MRNKTIIMAVLMSIFICACSGSSTGTVGNGDGDGDGDGDGNGGGNNNGGTTTYSISGTITGPAAASATVTLSGGGAATTTTDANGNYSFTGLSTGDYTVTPSKDSSAFNPSNRGVTLTADSTSDFGSAAYQSASVISSTTVDGTVSKCFSSSDFATDATGNAGKEQAAVSCDGDDKLYRTFFSFDLASAGIGTSATIVSTTLSFNQTSLTGTPYTGNSLTIDHVNYGDTLGTDDWNTTALTSPVATNTTSTVGVITISTESTDLKDAVQSDVAERRRTQFRLSFLDAIAAGNYITIERGTGATNPPTLTVTYYSF